MANCADMKEGDLFVCDACGLELRVEKACTCSSGEEGACSVPLQCCGKDMVKKIGVTIEKSWQGPLALPFHFLQDTSRLGFDPILI